MSSELSFVCRIENYILSRTIIRGISDNTRMPVKAEFQQLQEEDPEFYQFLLENDKDIIESDQSEASDDDMEVDEPEKDLHYQIQNLNKDNIKFITRTFKKCFEDGDFNLDSTESFEELTKCVFEDSVALIQSELKLEDTFKKYASEKQYFKFKNAIKNIISCFIHFLETQPCDQSFEDDHVIENPLMVSVLAQSSSIIQLAYGFPNMLKKLILASAGIFGKSRSVMMKAKGLAVIKLVVHAKSGRKLFNDNKMVDKSLLETSIKILYKTYLENSRQVHERNLTLISFMSQSIVSELCGIDLETTYLLAYQYLRQIANLTRLAYDHKIEKKVHHVYGWSCLQAMRLWGLFISSFAIQNANLLNAIRSMNDNKVINAKSGNHANMLIYPFVQLCHAILQLQPTARYFPFTFHLVNVMIAVNKATGTMVPVIQYLLRIVQSPAVAGELKNPTIKNIEMGTTIRASKMHINTVSYQQSLIEICHDVFINAIAVHSHKIYFCDWCVPIYKMMKTLEKQSANKKLKLMMHQLCTKIDESKQYLLKQRKGVKFGPCDLDLINEWENNLPKLAPIAILQQNIEKVQGRMAVEESIPADIVKTTTKVIVKEIKQEDAVEKLVVSDDEDAIKPKRKKGNMKKTIKKKQEKKQHTESNASKKRKSNIGKNNKKVKTTK